MKKELKAEELRIGNLCTNHNGEGVSVSIRLLSDFGRGAIGLFGIPLNEEWLIKSGFEKTITKMRIVDYKDYRKDNFVLAVIDKGVEVEYCALNIEDRTYIGIFQYVHQLQNLYYALTGTELTFKD